MNLPVKQKHFLSFSRKLFLSMISLFLVFAFCFIAYQYQREREYKVELLNTQLQNYNSRLYERLNSNPAIEETTEKYIRDHALEDLRVTLIDLQGNVIYDSYQTTDQQLENHLNRPEVQKALKDGTGFDVRRTSETTGLPYFYSATRYGDYIIRSALPYNVSLINNLQADPHYLWFTVIVSLLLMVIFYKFTNKLGTSIGGISVFKYTSFNSGFEIVDDLGGNIFPSAILSVATTDAQVITPSDSTCLGNPKSCIAVRVKSRTAYSRVRIEVAETPFFSRSVSEFVLNKPRTEYTIYPDIIWNYEALKNNAQAEPVSVAVKVEMNGKDLGQRVRTFSVRSVNECLLGYVANGTKFYDTSIFFAAYVNEENPMIDQLLREALNTRIVNRFLGYQSTAKGAVDKQVYALWNILQKRKFRYSSVSNTSLSSNVVFSQRVRTFDDALESSQINCVDGSVLFASLLRAINIEPILVRTPGHMFVGYYTDNSHKDMNFLETTMIGDVDLDDFFPDEQLDSTMVGKSQNEMSLLTFEKSKQYANKKYKDNEAGIHSGKLNYMFLEISKEVRRKIQPIGK
jgi:hypothetical protein